MLKFFANKKGLFGYFCDPTKVALGFGGQPVPQSGKATPKLIQKQLTI